MNEQERILAEYKAALRVAARELDTAESRAAEWQARAEEKDRQLRDAHEQLRRERRTFPAPGVWLVTDQPARHIAERMALLGDVPEPVAWAAFWLRRDAIAAAVRACWQQYRNEGSQSPADVAEAILRAAEATSGGARAAGASARRRCPSTL